MSINLQVVNGLAKVETKSVKRKKRSAASDEIITLTNVSKAYATGAPALNGVDLHIKASFT